MTRNELKQLWFSLDYSNVKEKKEIIVETDFGHVEIISEGINGFTKFIDNSLCNKVDMFELNEISNTAEDMIFWISEDVKSGYVDSTRADSYINNLEQIIKEIE